MSVADTLLPHLEKVKRTGPGKWVACCPAHDDRSPSLSIKEGDDGRLLVHCWSGCAVDAIVGALGPSLADLFPPRPDAPGAGHKPQRRPWSAVDLVDLAAHESAVAMLVALDVAHGRAADLDRLLVAAGRLADIQEAVHAR